MGRGLYWRENRAQSICSAGGSCRLPRLRVVKSARSDYVKTEHGVSSDEWKRTAKNLHAKAQKTRKAGKAHFVGQDQFRFR